MMWIATYFDLWLAIPIFHVQAAEEYTFLWIIDAFLIIQWLRNMSEKNLDAERMNREGGADA